MRLPCLLGALLLATGACRAWDPPSPATTDLDRGLVVLYPGALNSRQEMMATYEGLRMAGVDSAIEVAPWASAYANLFDERRRVEENRRWSVSEARRIAAFVQSHPNAPVVLIGASAGAMIAIMVAESLPEGTSVDRLVLIGPDVSRGYPLAAALDHTRRGAVSYSSMLDGFSVWAAMTFATYDGLRDLPAATTGFDEQDPRLVQLRWEWPMAADGSLGQHLDYSLLPLWIRDVIAPWVLPGS